MRDEFYITDIENYPSITDMNSSLLQTKSDIKNFNKLLQLLDQINSPRGI